MTETELRDAVRRSQREGFRLLFGQYRSYVYTIVWNSIASVGTCQDAEETVSDIFADVFRRFSEIQEGSLQAYIGSVARRKAIKAFHRLAGRCDTVSLDEAENTAFTESPEADAEQAAQNAMLLQKIRELGHPDSDIVLQKYYYGRSAAEIGKSLGMKPSAVRKRLSRALQRLRGLLEAEDFTL